MNRQLKSALIFLFFLSGFSGLIYESIWSHYLKLFLGHAAYAQTLVLIIFMGGMAVGAWLAAKHGDNSKRNLLFLYATVELVIGILAIAFHEIFVEAIDLSFNVVIPSLHSALVINTYKWLLAGLIITPQSILLGATFPLMSAGFIRYFPDSPGKSIATLYFVNSLGACIGVLVSSFVLVKTLGLPGTIITAGFINIILSTFVFILVKNTQRPTASPDLTNAGSATAEMQNKPDHAISIWLAIAAFTGTASFIYEITWIRMLNLVLGSSTHAFELMLSVFILGLALGGLYIRKRIDTGRHTMKMLAGVQLVMGIMAASSIVLYNPCFEAMSFVITHSPKDKDGYLLYNLGSYAITLLIMLPATFCAGMTLPLLTYSALRSGFGEKSIGFIYAANTLGSIFGVILAVHFLLPVLGLKKALIIGALIDMALAVYLLKKFTPENRQLHSRMILAGIGTLAVISLFANFNIHYMMSGVFRHGSLVNHFSSVYHRDGKTASIDVMSSDKELSIATNGKPDASIGLDVHYVGPDEPTMMLLAWLPLSFQPQAKNIAVVGMGSGMTTHSALALPDIANVDTIEIEPAMVEGAKHFGDRVIRAFNDPRSDIHIEDAKTFFTSHPQKYDLIISEPSNPWVSGVSSLFSTEFYRQTRGYLADDGILAQWIHLYEMDDNLVGAILKAVNNNFDDYQLYVLGYTDMLIIAKPKGSIGAMSHHLFGIPAIHYELNRIRIPTPLYLDMRLLGDKAFFAPYLQSLAFPANSDYYPVVDQYASEARFKLGNAQGFSNKTHLFNLLAGKQPASLDEVMLADDNKINVLASYYRDAWRIYKQINNPALHYYNDDKLTVLGSYLAGNCTKTGDWMQSLSWLADKTLPFLPRTDSQALWKSIMQNKCYASLAHEEQLSVSLLYRFSEQAYQPLIDIFLAEKTGFNSSSMMKWIAISYLNTGQAQGVLDLQEHYPELSQDADMVFLLQTARYRLETAGQKAEIPATP